MGAGEEGRERDLGLTCKIIFFLIKKIMTIKIKNNWSSIVSYWKKSMTGMHLNWVQLSTSLWLSTSSAFRGDSIQKALLWE